MVDGIKEKDERRIKEYIYEVTIRGKNKITKRIRHISWKGGKRIDNKNEDEIEKRTNRYRKKNGLTAKEENIKSSLRER